MDTCSLCGKPSGGRLTCSDCGATCFTCGHRHGHSEECATCGHVHGGVGPWVTKTRPERKFDPETRRFYSLFPDGTKQFD